MIAVYELAKKIAAYQQIAWQPQQVLVATTRWVIDDPSSNLSTLATELGIPLVCSEFHFRDSKYPQLNAYEQGFVKEGVGAGASTIVAHLYRQWEQTRLLLEIEETFIKGSSQKSHSQLNFP